MNDQNNPYAAPQAAVKDVGELVGGFDLATRGSRFLASMLDGLILLGLVWAASFLTPWDLFTTDERDIQGTLALAAMSLAIWAALNAYLLFNRGQTVGKVALGIKILRANGSPASFGRAAGMRYMLPMVINQVPVVGPIFSLVDALMIFRDSRRCLHDHIADTIVVKV